MADRRPREEISVQGMELGCVEVKLWIWLTQAGDPQVNGREGFGHCVSDHRFVPAEFASAAHGTDEQVLAAAAEFWVAQVFSEGLVMPCLWQNWTQCPNIEAWAFQCSEVLAWPAS